MIAITCLDGPWAGQVRHFAFGLNLETGERTLGNIETADRVDPAELFASFTRHGWRWEANYSEATDEEILLWFRADLAARVMRALSAGLPVNFLGKVWRIESDDDLLRVAGDMEDAIVASGRLVTIDSDDETGLVIGVRGYEI